MIFLYTYVLKFYSQNSQYDQNNKKCVGKLIFL